MLGPLLGVIIFAHGIADAAIPLKQCPVSSNADSSCVIRGSLDPTTQRFVVHDGLNDQSFPSVTREAFSTFRFGSGQGYLMYSLPSKLYQRGANQVEAFNVRLATDGTPLAFSVIMKQSLGPVLGRAAIVHTSQPLVLMGPQFSAKDSPKPVEEAKTEDTEPSEEPSFLRKYWWVILGAMLLSSVMSPSDGQRQPASSSN